jgi:predicted AAA+ superfamily ATPase
MLYDDTHGMHHEPIGDHIALEVKAKRNVGDSDLRSLRALAEEGKMKHYICVALEPRRRKVGNIMILPFAEFLGELWAGRYR